MKRWALFIVFCLGILGGAYIYGGKLALSITKSIEDHGKKTEEKLKRWKENCNCA